MKNYFLSLCCLSVFYMFGQNSKVIDSAAIHILDKMGESIGKIHSCNFQISRALDNDGMFGMEKHFYFDDITMVGPDKMLVKTRSADRNRNYYYNGSKFIYYSLDENNYCVVDAPNTIIKMIDSLHKKFSIRFPAADVFYPSLTDDLLEEFPTIVYNGTETIDDVECQEILASNNKMNFQLWITNDEKALPKKIVIIHKDGDRQQYEATFKNWKINTDVEDTIFNFYPPEGSKNISIMATSK
ncbi:DUF2092 domain-containing protein [Galbibacter pacificus]|uniref:DUF2092 domain-containing protein n=1 Tax=Galbibacter pacificus TaxID=2996052 RepID=A0ABT6FV64_9FLAO|nr:DUF2092 domain-containing protein [Galbibacter pacificus]MDG3583921.1 DUF2092 domain-containing protein [Galbibacter pacificus]MDG3587161.1 DUF2092 domain-containing protein [Galbibacter pacificus]